MTTYPRYTAFLEILAYVRGGDGAGYTGYFCDLEDGEVYRLIKCLGPRS